MGETPKLRPLPRTDAIRKAPTVDGTRIRLYANQVVARRYEIVERLGRGEMGEVWHAYDLKLRVDVALKAIRASTPETIEGLRREVRIAREVVSPNVCRLFDLIEMEGQELVSMEYIDGITLLRLLAERSPLDLRQAYDIASQFLAGLVAIHQAGLVHRDLKPENIMITKTGRVVVMDFGIAKYAGQITNAISGTPPYMAPEQLAGEKVDSRADIFAAGAVIAEMISTIRDHKSREYVWDAIREDPAKLPAGVLQPVIARAVAKQPEDRFPSAVALLRTLQETTQTAETIEERNPYPGLSAFTEANREYFFGREVEIETALKKLHDLHFIAIIGPSGAGKTSFLRAGLIPVLPRSWSYSFTHPGDSPFVNLVQALSIHFTGDAEAIQKMVRPEDMDGVLWLLNRWRKKHQETVLILDRFEELFTLNDSETQKRFAGLIGRTILECDVRVLLCMRDDFLIFCREQPSLAPIFSDLTALLPLKGEALKRALTQPALKCGYQFEDEILVDEILADVEKERGALPLMAFAAAGLWEKREPQNRKLTRDAYRELGGVAGALAQHAEATMRKIGSDRHGIVREIFRNLVTLQNTRAARDCEEILSVFEDRKAAEEVLDKLIDSRLLTSFESAPAEGEKPRRRVEIIHESLLSAWPRLVRWQTQDADHAQLREQLRQGAHVWNDRSRPVELLWSGAPYKEFELWRQKYRGGLTKIEKDFADAMLHRSRQQRVRRWMFASTIFVILILVLGIVAALWRGEKSARQEAVSQAKRAEASKLLALGRTELQQDPTLALAYAIASLETADTTVGRRFAVEALWNGPPAFIITDVPIRPTILRFSPDGKHLAAGGFGGVRLFYDDGTQPAILGEGYAQRLKSRIPQFTQNGDSVLWRSAHDPSIVRVWSVSQRKEIRRFQLEGETIFRRNGSSMLMFTRLDDVAPFTPDEFDWKKCRIRIWSLDENEPRVIGDWNLTDIPFPGPPGSLSIREAPINNDGRWLAYYKGGSVYVRSIDTGSLGPEIFVGGHDDDVASVVFDARGTMLASADTKGEIRLWSFPEKSKTPFRVIPARGPVSSMFFSKSGSIFTVGYNDKTLRLWNMSGPADAGPLMLRRGIDPAFPFIVVDPSDKWAAAPYRDSLAFWPLTRAYPYVLSDEGDHGAGTLIFAPDGNRLAASFDAKIRQWQFDNFQTPTNDIESPSVSGMQIIDLDPTGKYYAVPTNEGTFLMSVDGEIRRMPWVGSGVVSFSPDGRVVASESYGEIPLWNLQSDQVRVLKPTEEMSRTWYVRFSPDGRLISGHENGNVYRWNLETGTSNLIAKGNHPVWRIVIPKSAPHLVVVLWNNVEQLDAQKSTSELRVVNLRTAKTDLITTHGNRVTVVAVDPSGKLLVTGDVNGVVRGGPLTGEEPHLFFGQENAVMSIAIHPDRSWIVASEFSRPVLRVWRTPKGKPLHTLPHEELLNKLRSLTNVRVIADQTTSTGYRIQFDRFPGWENVPTW